MNVLFTCVGRRNYLLNYLREVLKPGDKIFATDMQRTAPGMADADVAIEVPSIYDAGYIEAILGICEEHHIDAIISLNDLELPILSAHKSRFEAQGTRVLISSPEVIDITFDKLRTANFLRGIGLLTPKTFTKKEELTKALDEGEIDFPIVVKPRWGSASIGIEMPKDFEEFELTDRLSRLKLRRTILSTASAQQEAEALLYQEFLPGKEYGMDVLNDLEGNYVGTFVREKLSMRAGETDKAMSVIAPRFEVIGKTISQNLRHIGNLDCDVMEKEGNLYVLELNARFGGGYPFSHEAGARGIACYYEWLSGNSDVGEYLRYKPGLCFAKCDRLISVG